MNELYLALAIGAVVVLLVVRFWRRSSGGGTPSMGISVQGTGVEGWWTLKVQLKLRSDIAWAAQEVQVPEPDGARIISLHDAVGTGGALGKTVFDEIDIVRISSRSKTSLLVPTEQPSDGHDSSVETFLVFAPPSPEPRDLLVRLTIASQERMPRSMALTATTVLHADA